MNRYLAFDIEVCKWPEEGNNWRDIAPLGISCAGLMGTGWIKPEVFYAGDVDGPQSRPMNKEELELLWSTIYKDIHIGYKLVGWNSLQFDLACLCIELENIENYAYAQQVKDVALNHIDPMFHIFCTLGWPVGLEAVSQGLGLEGKLKKSEPGEATFGAKAPELWMDGTDEDRLMILDYVGQDAVATLEIVKTGIQQKFLRWQSRSGKPYRLYFSPPKTVKECLELPEKDNSWMDNPLHRKDFYSWTQ